MKINIMNFLFVTGLSFAMLELSSCATDEGTPLYEAKADSSDYTWEQTADSVQERTYNTYRSADGQYFIQNNAGNTNFNYWWNAHMLDVLVDGYVRTKNESYQTKMAPLLEGIKSKNGSTLINEYYDDMEWLAISSLRAFQATGNQNFKSATDLLWADIKTGWTDLAGGGLMWRKSTPNSKNACANATASIVASRLYLLDKNPDDLEWAKKIYAWQKANLVDPSSGIVWDNLSVDGGVITKNKDWKFTYNQGTYIGAGLELYHATKDKAYLVDAMRTATTCMNSADINKDGILKNENQGDGGLFKGILARYMTLLAQEPDLSETDRKNLTAFLIFNAQTFYTKGISRPAMLAGPDWSVRPSAEVDFSTQLSGLMLLEAAATLAPAKDE